MQAAIGIVAQGSLMLLILSAGLQSSWSDLAYVLQRPSLLLRAFVAVNLVVPVCAVLLCLVLPIDRTIEAGLVIMAVSPLAPLVLGKMLKSGADRAYVIGAYAALIAASVIVVPATIELLAILLGTQASLPIAPIARLILISVALPLGAGVAIRTAWGELGDRAARVAAAVAYACLVPIILIIIYRTAGAALSLIGDGSLALIILTLSAGIAAGHLLGGPEPSRRVALAQAAATRHPGIAAIIVQRNFDDRRVMLAVILFLLTSIVISAMYGKWMTSRTTLKMVSA